MKHPLVVDEQLFRAIAAVVARKAAAVNAPLLALAGNEPGAPILLPTVQNPGSTEYGARLANKDLPVLGLDRLHSVDSGAQQEGGPFTVAADNTLDVGARIDPHGVAGDRYRRLHYLGRRGRAGIAGGFSWIRWLGAGAVGGLVDRLLGCRGGLVDDAGLVVPFAGKGDAVAL